MKHITFSSGQYSQYLPQSVEVVHLVFFSAMSYYEIFFSWCGIRRIGQPWQPHSRDSSLERKRGKERVGDLMGVGLCRGKKKNTCFTITWKRVSHLDFLTHNCLSNPTKRKMGVLKLSSLRRTTNHNITSSPGTWSQWQNVEIGFLSQLFLY